MVAMMCLRAHAAAPTLPPGSIAPDTIVVIHLDAAGISPESLKTAAQTILGANAKVADEAVAQFKEKYDKAIAAGAVSATMVVGADKKDGGADKKNGAIYIKLKPGADAKALEKMIKSDMKGEEKEKTVFTEKDGYLVIHEKDMPLSDKSDSALEKTFADALGTVSNAAVQIAIVPDEKIKAEILKNSQNEAPVKGLKDAAAIIAKSKWMTVSVTFGNTPGIALAANTGDAAAAKQLSDSINTSLDELKAKAADPNGAGQLAMVAPLIGPVVEGLRPTTTGSQVSVALKGQTLTTIGNFLAQMGLLGGGPK